MSTIQKKAQSNKKTAESRAENISAMKRNQNVKWRCCHFVFGSFCLLIVIKIALTCEHRYKLVACKL